MFLNVIHSVDLFFYFLVFFFFFLYVLKSVSPRLFFNLGLYHLVLFFDRKSNNRLISFFCFLLCSIILFIFLGSFNFDFFFHSIQFLFFLLVFYGFFLPLLKSNGSFGLRFVYKLWYRRLYKFFFFVIGYSMNYCTFFDKFFIGFSRFFYFLFSRNYFVQKSSASDFTVTIRWNNVIIFSLFDLDFHTFIDSISQHFGSRYYPFLNFTRFIKSRPYFLSSLNSALNHTGSVALFKLFNSLGVGHAIHLSHLDDSGHGNTRKLYSYDLDLACYFSSLDDLKSLLVLLDWSVILNQGYYPGSPVHHVRLSLINLIYGNYYSYFLFYIRSFFFFFIPFRSYFFMFFLCFFSFFFHFLFIFTDSHYIFAIVYIIILSDVIFENDVVNFFIHFFLNCCVFFFGVFGFFFIFAEIIYFFLIFFNQRWFYRPFEHNYPFPHYLNKHT